MGTLRVHFTADDYLRVRVAPGVDATWEIVLSLLKLQSRRHFTAFESWRRSISPAVGPWLRALTPIVPLGPYFADFMTPADGVHGVDAAIDTIMRTPGRQLRREVEILGAGHRLPSWSHDLAAGRPAFMASLGETLHRYHRQVLAPDWPRIVQAVEQDRARRLADLAAGGCAGLLNGLGPLMRWDPPVLETPYCVDQDLHLDGRGLVLTPSFFCWEKTVTLADPGLPPVLVYPVERDLDFRPVTAGPRAAARAGGPRSLAALLGPTRAALLALLSEPCTTTELARRAEVSSATASEHATVLRKAGLVTTTRQGGSVSHRRSPLGDLLVAGHPAGD